MNVNLILLSRTMRRDLFVFLRAALRFIGESIQNTGIKTMLKKCLFFTFLIDLRNEYPVLKNECSFIILVLITKTGAELGSVLAAIIIKWILLGSDSLWSTNTCPAGKVNVHLTYWTFVCMNRRKMLHWHILQLGVYLSWKL